MKVAFLSTIAEIARYSGGILLAGDPSRIVKSITTDSRDLGDECFFVPIRGTKFDGHDFIAALVHDKKIVGFLTERDAFADMALQHGAAAIVCDSSLSAYGEIARTHRMRMPAKVIGITGTNGKTTTKELLWSLLTSSYRCHKNEKNFNNEIGVPHALLGLSADHEYAVIEMGMNHPGEIARLSHIVQPDIAIITSVGEGHLEFLGSVENVARAKAEIIRGMKPDSLLYVNADSPYVEIVAEEAGARGVRLKTFALDAKADIMPEKMSLGVHEVEIVYRGELYRAPLYGMHNAYNLLIALAIALDLGVTPEKAKEALARIEAVDKRSEIIECDCTVINDTYNSNPLSAKSALISAERIFPEARKIAVLSDMKELGKESARYHRDLGRRVALHGFFALYSWGEFSRDIIEGACEEGMPADNALDFSEKEEMIAALLKTVKQGDVVLIKGSRSMKMEEVTDALVRKQ